MSDLSLPGCLCIPFVYRSATKHRLTPPTVQSRLQARSAAYAIAPAEGRGASPVGKAFGPRRRMKRLEDQGAVERVVVPDTDDAMPTKPCRKHSSWSLPPWECQASTCCHSVGAHLHETTATNRRRDAGPSTCQLRG
jgi:hypothetical protein